VQKVEPMAAAYLQKVKQLPPDQIGAKKDEVRQVGGALDFLSKNNVLPLTFGPKTEADNLIKRRKWNRK